MTSFLDMLGAPKLDLRKKHKCKLCGISITRKNFAMASNSYLGADGNWSETSVYCKGCYLKPEALSLS